LGGISGFIGGKAGEAIKLGSLLPKGTKIKQIWGGEIAMIFQDPMKFLNPGFSIVF